MAKKKTTKTLTTRMNEVDAEIQILKADVACHKSDILRQEKFEEQRKCGHSQIAVNIYSGGTFGDAVCYWCGKAISRNAPSDACPRSVKRIYRKFVKKGE